MSTDAKGSSNSAATKNGSAPPAAAGNGASQARGARWFRVLDEPRAWEEFYRRRWSYDKTVRTSHSVNCSGSCSWEVFVKDGMITWELQKTDWPQINDETPNYEPRGCQRGISSSWYPYSPVRPKYPYIRGVLLDFYRAERELGKGPVEAWAAIVEDEARSKAYRTARGKAGWRRGTWDESTEIIAAATIYTIQRYGADHLASFSPIPAMSMVSFISGQRLANLLGGTMLSFYEWYHDLPHMMPAIWGDQTDVAEAADWYQSAYWIVAGTNLPMTRTPDAHFASEHKYNGGKIVNLSPDYADITKFADLWVPLKPGTDSAFLLACIHVILQEFHVAKRSDYFLPYVAQYTNLPFLVRLDEEDGHFVSGRFLRASDLEGYEDEEHGDWKLMQFDTDGGLRLPLGSLGFRWEERTTGRWNLKQEDARSGEAFEPALTVMDGAYEEATVAFADFTHTFNVEFGTTEGKGVPATANFRGVPSRMVQTKDGPVRVTTAYDLLLAQFGVGRGLSGAYPEGYDDASQPFTPAWQEQETGVDRNLVLRVAREWADTAEKTNGKCMFITGSGALHWYHGGPLTHRAMAVMGILTGCMGRNGGGFNNYVGTEKVRPFAAIGTLGGAADWDVVSRQANSTSYFYFHTDQWRYDGMTLEPLWAPRAKVFPGKAGHVADMNMLAVRNGWLPFFPQFDKRNPMEVLKQAREAGCTTDAQVATWVAKQFRDGELEFALRDVDAPENHPKVLWIYRGNLIGTSMRGHEYALKHLLGTHNNVLGDDRSEDLVDDIEWHDDAPHGKLDLVYNVNLRMDSSANYSDIVLPTAHWYEKYDLTCTDLHSFFHPFTPAHDPSWESKHDWDAFKHVAAKISELAMTYLSEPVEDLVMTALSTDTPDELAQPLGELVDWWATGETPVPGKTFPNVSVVTRDYTKILDKYTTLGPAVSRPNGYGAKGIKTDLSEIVEELKESYLVGEKNGLPSMEDAKQVAEIILRISPESDGEVAYQIFRGLEKRTGVPLAHLAEHDREIRHHYPDLVSQPRRAMTSPHWSAIESGGRTYASWTMNVETLKPWHTLSGRQEVYFDHRMFRELGEDLPTYKPPVDMIKIGDVSAADLKLPGTKAFRYITPHGKWSIHSMFWDTWHMLNMFRGGQVVWINDDDAREISVGDNDWVELYNENGISVVRAVVSATIPRDMAIFYHSSERHVNVPFSSLARERGASDLRGGNNNAATRIMMNPATMVGGYANWTYWLNYQGPSPSERDAVVLIRKKPLEAGGRKVIYREEQLGRSM
ncbi:MAG: nitrate reductase subunit alpha [Truepera sp.]|jgi:nitrate reductase alpha subunit|nr:nitrate reductase subunit alpha [Truepera sp.]